MKSQNNIYRYVKLFKFGIKMVQIGVVVVLLCASTSIYAQTNITCSLTAEDAVRLALQYSPAVRSAAYDVSAASAAVQQTKARCNPQLELAPGVGFTNGNSILSQRLDSSERSALTRISTGELKAAQAELVIAQLGVISETQTAYFDLIRAKEVAAAVADSVETAKALSDALKKRVELGEAAPYEATRAEIEADLTEQELLLARSDVKKRLAALNRLLGLPSDQEIMLCDKLSLPNQVTFDEKTRLAVIECHPQVLVACGRVEMSQGGLLVAKASRRPVISADIASDIWSMDRDPFQIDNLGFQLRLAMPLIDRGSIKADERRAQADIEAKKSDVNAVKLQVALAIEQTEVDFCTRRQIADRYITSILPKSQLLLDSAAKGFNTGLTSVIEVLDAQRVARQTRVNSVNALFEAVRSRIALDTATTTTAKSQIQEVQ